MPSLSLSGGGVKALWQLETTVVQTAQGSSDRMEVAREPKAA